MKGLSKYIDDSAKKLSIGMLGEEYKAVMSPKLKLNNYIIKEDQHKIHLNKELCEQLRHEKDKIYDLLSLAINDVKKGEYK